MRSPGTRLHRGRTGDGQGARPVRRPGRRPALPRLRQAEPGRGRGDIQRLAHGGSDGVALSAVQRPEAGARRRRTQASDAEARPDRAGLAAVLRIRMEAPRADANVHKSRGKPC